jgi:hypothetical protein
VIKDFVENKILFIFSLIISFQKYFKFAKQNNFFLNSFLALLKVEKCNEKKKILNYFTAYDKKILIKK